jgi:exopolysaccharide/PEP-CTERM locus tyrosine autokinase
MSVVEKTLRKLRQEADPASIADAADGASYQDAAPTSASPVIEFSALHRAGLTPSESDERRLMAEYRQIKRPLVANAVTRGAPILRNGHLIVVASAMPGEGKTFTAVNLALSMSFEKDLHVVLVDADTAKPQLTQVLGVTDSPGLLDALREQTFDPEQAILPTDVPNLSFMPAGRHSAEATELLASTRMAQVAGALTRRDRQRILLFDSPPLLLTNESRVLTQLAGQVVVVVRAESTPHPVVLDALDLLEGEPAVYLVLNQSSRSSTEAYYYYGYRDVVRERTSGKRVR